MEGLSDEEIASLFAENRYFRARVFDTAVLECGRADIGLLEVGVQANGMSTNQFRIAIEKLVERGDLQTAEERSWDGQPLKTFQFNSG